MSGSRCSSASPRVSRRLSPLLLLFCFAGFLPGAAQAGYTFTGGGTAAGVATGDTAVTTLYIEQSGGLVFHSTDGLSFSSDWGGGLTIAATAANSLTINVSTGDGSSVVIGGALSNAASLNLALIAVNAGAGNTADTLVVDETTGTDTAYTLNTSAGQISGTGLAILEGVPSFGGGVTFRGPGTNATYSIPAVYAGTGGILEPVTVVAGTGSDTFNVAQDAIGSPLGIDGGSPVPPAAPGDTLTVAPYGTNPALTSTATAAGLQGQYTSSGNAAISFQHIETLTPGAATHFSVTAPAVAVLKGATVSVTVTALDAVGLTATAYAGIVHFTSTDPAAILPADSTLTGGTKVFSVTLNTSGFQTVTATDTVTATITGTSNAIPVAVAAAPAPTLNRLLESLLVAAIVMLALRQRALRRQEGNPRTAVKA